ncbi:MAG: signal peptidase I [Chloroflexi bacterium]|nr:signal peptidase I [Chloroflexota bacterium]
MKSFLRDILTTLLLAAVIFFGLQFTIQHSVVISPSMMPSLQVNQHLIINKLAYRWHEPQRGDIIVFHPANHQPGDYIKRVIGLPGESVEIKEGKVYIHQKDGSVLPLDEPYIAERAARPFTGGTIPENEYFMLGDNRNNSGDSRGGWTVPRQKIVGKAWLSIWPQDRWGLAPNYPLSLAIASLTRKYLPLSGAD